MNEDWVIFIACEFNCESPVNNCLWNIVKSKYEVAENATQVEQENHNIVFQ